MVMSVVINLASVESYGIWGKLNQAVEQRQKMDGKKPCTASSWDLVLGTGLLGPCHWGVEGTRATDGAI